MTDRGDLPPFMATNVGEDIEVQPEVWYHNWLYSVNPGDVTVFDRYDKDGREVFVQAGQIFLVGYCKNCGKGFTQRIPHPDGLGASVYVETQLQVAKEGCVAPTHGA